MTFESLLITNKQAKRYFVADRLRAAAGSGSTGITLQNAAAFLGERFSG